MGRWAAQGSEDVYVRTAVRVTENLQRYAAAHARLALGARAAFPSSLTHSRSCSFVPRVPLSGGTLPLSLFASS